ncbi:MAG: hypothetical protein WCA84_04810 [Ignavibacteriaceae bacterium]
MNFKKYFANLSISLLISIVVGAVVGFRISDLKAGVFAGLISFILNILILVIVVKADKEKYFIPISILGFILVITTMSWISQPTFQNSLYLYAKRKIPIGILVNFERWEFQANLLRFIYDLIALIAASASILVTLRLKDNKDKILRYAAYVSALSLGTITAFNLGEKANNFRNAWRNMHTAIIKYEELPDFSVEELIKSYDLSEKMIGDVKPDPR